MEQEANQGEATGNGNEPELMTTRWINGAMSRTKQVLSEKFFNANVYWLSLCGLYGLYVTAAIGLLISIILAVRIDSFVVFIAGMGGALLCIVLQYIAAQFLSLSKTAVDSTPSHLSSEAFPQCISLIFLLSGIISFLSLFVLSIQQGNLTLFFAGVGCLVFFGYYFTASIHPSLLNVQIVKGLTAGEEAIGLLSFLLKGFLRLVPVWFGAGVVLGTLNLVVHSIKIFGDYPAYAMGMLSSSAVVVLVMASLPFMGFLVFLFHYLTVDLIRSVIEIPKKLDNRQ